MTREGVGVYRISNILGPHSDKAWGGIDGGFEIPKDRNGQRLIWLDYEVEADGSIIVKPITVHTRMRLNLPETSRMDMRKAILLIYRLTNSFPFA